MLGYAVADACAIATIDGDGKINIGPLMKIHTSPGLPSELCWLAVSPDDRLVRRTSATATSARFASTAAASKIAKDPACPKVSGDGTARGLNTTVTSGPSDNWITPDGAYLYDIYGNASKLVGYATQPDGSLKEITSAKCP